MKPHNIFLGPKSIFLIIALLFVQGKAQTLSVEDLRTLDSLLVAENFAQVHDFFLLQEKQIQTSHLSSEAKQEFESLKSLYLSTNKNLGDVSKITDERAAILIAQYATYSKKFEEPAAGEKASTLYGSFITLSQKGEARAALKNYYLASHFHDRHKRAMRQWVHGSLAKIQKQRAQKEYTEALTLLQEVEAEASHHQLNEREQDEILFLKRDLQKRIGEQRMHSEFWDKTEPLKHSWFIHADPNLAYNHTIKNAVWELSVFSPLYGDVLFTYEYIFDLKAKFGPGFEVDLGHALVPKLRLRVAFSYNNYSYGTGDISSINPTLHTNVYAAHGFLRYFMRERVGLRPFLGLGMGGTHVNREGRKSATGIIDAIWHEQLESEKVSMPQFVAEIGYQYVNHPQSRFLYEVFFSVCYNSRRSQLLSRVNLGTGAKVGIGF